MIKFYVIKFTGTNNSVGYISKIGINTFYTNNNITLALTIPFLWLAKLVKKYIEKIMLRNGDNIDKISLIEFSENYNFIITTNYNIDYKNINKLDIKLILLFIINIFFITNIFYINKNNKYYIIYILILLIYNILLIFIIKINKNINILDEQLRIMNIYNKNNFIFYNNQEKNQYYYSLQKLNRMLK